MKNSLIINSSYKRLDEFIKNQTQLSEVTNEVYLTAGGYYQECYIAIFEELTSTNESHNSINEFEESNVKFIAELFVKELIKKFPSKKFPFNKIISVTLPSQIISKAICDNLNNRGDIEFYTNKTEHEYTKEIPKLIRLASYYSFSEEVQFKNIIAGDKVLVVNDVISTGNLIKDIYENISTIGKNEDNLNPASVSCILSVVDSRMKITNTDENKFKQSIFFNDINNDFSEDIFISLIRKEIIKFKENPHPDKKLVRINPIHNARITIESRHSEEDRIAYKNAKDFLEKIPIEAMVIGHFSQNSLHHPYFITTVDLFKDTSSGVNPGVQLVKSIYSEVSNKEQKYDLDFHIKSILFQLNSFEELMNSYEVGSNFQIEKYKNELIGYLESTKKLAKHKKSNKSFKPKALEKDDFIFYPVFSGIDNLTVERIQDLFKVDYNNIQPLQRFDTNKGWRFIIPPKSLNNKLKGKKALILDMGSFTGDSIIQMIDAMCVFELKKIIVISLIGRLEDFDREFFSRIREMKVKILNSSTKSTSITQSIVENTLAPVNIYFGTNLHIPPSQSSKVCEHCQEIKMLEEFKMIKEFQTTSAINYISERLKQLSVIHVADIKEKCPNYFPLLKNGFFDVFTFFKVRDHLGKIDGYRFYSDYYYYFDELKEECLDYRKNIEAIIAVSFHEKHLVKTIQNQLPDVKKKIVEYINNVIVAPENLKLMYYNWTTISILETYFLFNNSLELFETNNLLYVLKFIENNSIDYAFDYGFIAYKFAIVYKSNKKENLYFQNQLILSIKKIWLMIEDKNKLKYFSLISTFNRIIVNDESSSGSEKVKSFYNIYNMYDKASAYKPSHSELGNSISNIYNSIVAHEINKSQSNEEFLEDIINQYIIAKNELQDLNQNIDNVISYLSLQNKLFQQHMFAPEYLGGEKSLKRYFEKLDKLTNCKSYNNLDIEGIISILKELLFEYFSPSKEYSFYSHWKDTNTLSLLSLWTTFENINNSEENQLFLKYLGNRNYSNLITTKLSSFSIVKDETYTNVGVNIHPFLLIKICKELLDNSFKYAENSEVKILLKESYSAESDMKYSIFEYEQNCCSKGKPKKGLEAIRQILEDFNGNFKYIDVDENKLKIEIRLPIIKYKAN